MACYDTSPYTCTYDSGGTGSLPGGGDPDYSSIATWEADSDNDLSGLGIVTLECYDSQVHIGVWPQIAGATNTDSTHHRRVISSSSCATPFAGKAGTGAEFYYSTGSYIVTIGEAFFELNSLCFEFQTGNAASPYQAIVMQDDDGIRILNCVIHDCVNSSYPETEYVRGITDTYGDNTTHLVYNTIVYGCSSSGIHMRGLYGTEVRGVINCTCIGNSTVSGYGIYPQASSGTMIAWGNYCADNAGGDFSGSYWDSPSGWNASKDDTADLNGTAGDNYKNSIDLITSGALDSDYLAVAGQTLSWSGGAGDNAGRNPYDDLSATYDFYDFFKNDTSGESISKLDIAGNERPTPDTADVSWSVGASYNPTPPNELEANLPTLEIESYGGYYLASKLSTLEIIGQFGSILNTTLPEITSSGTFLQFGLFALLPYLELEATGYQTTVLNKQLPVLELIATAELVPALYIDPRTDFQPILPNLKITAKSGERGSLIEKLPDLRIEVKTGSHVDLNIPTLELNASGSSAFSGNVNVSLPTLQLTSYSAGKVDKKLPSLQIESSGSAGTGLGTWILDKKLPTIAISAVSLTNHIIVDINLPPLNLDSSGSVNVIGTVDVNLSTIKITANMVINVSGEADTTLPELSITATGYCQSASLYSDLPTLIISPKGYGDDYDGTESSLSGPSRFDDFTLTYNRWAI